MKRTLEVGDHVLFIDSHRRRHPALVTRVHGMITEHEGEQSVPCVNLLWVDDDERKTDDYGRQINRESSCVHASNNSARANCFIFPDE